MGASYEHVSNPAGLFTKLMACALLHSKSYLIPTRQKANKLRVGI